VTKVPGRGAGRPWATPRPHGPLAGIAEPAPGLWREYVDSVTSQASPAHMTESHMALFVPFERT
jgi:hypothetical protein